jgi:4-amino-4-deoxy-L-arabinose transferase-like glycosyltransferase
VPAIATRNAETSPAYPSYSSYAETQRTITRPRAVLTRQARLRLVIGACLFCVGLIGAVVSQLWLSRPTAKNDPWLALSVLVASGLVWAVGCTLSARALPFAWVAEWPNAIHAAVRAPSLTRGRQIAAGVGVALSILAAGMWWFGRFETQQATRAVPLWLVALLLIWGALTRVTWRRPGLLSVLLPLALFVVAFVPRVWGVADLPLGVWFDEAQGALEIRRVVQQGTYTPILNTYGKDTSGFFYLIPALSVALGDNIGTARIAAALVGALTTSVTYLFTRELFGWRVGLAAGALLAFERWHLDFSRLGFNPVSLPLCATLAFWLLARAIRTRQWPDAAWAGLALGLGMHAYTGYRGTAIVVLLALVYAAVLHRWSPKLALPRLGVYVAGFALTALPVLVFAVQDPVTYNGRIAETLILTQRVSDAEKLRQIWDTVQRHALMFNVSGDLNGRHNLPGAPMLDAWSAVLVVLGFGWLIVRWRDWRTGALLAWSAVSLSGGILTLAFEAPQGARTIGITPVLAVLAGMGLIITLDRILVVATLSRAVRPWRATVTAAGVAALAVAWIGFTNLDTFFNRQMRNSDVFAAFSTRETIPVRTALQERGRYESILASTTMTPSVQAAYMTPDQRSNMRQFDPTGDLPYRGVGPGLVFLETEHDQALADAVARMYPDAVPRSYAAPDGGTPIVIGFRLAPELLSAHRGLLASYRGADGALVERREALGDAQPTDLGVALPADLTWHTALALDATGEYALRVPAGFQLRIDDVLLPQAELGGVRVRLVRGNHAVELSGKVDGTAPPRLEWRTPDTPDWHSIPPQVLFTPPPGGTGLQLTLSPGLDVGGQPKEEVIDPVLSHFFHVSPFSRLHLEPRVWSADWAGQLDVPGPGTYGFALDHSHIAGVWLDEQQILGNFNTPGDTRNAVLQLTGGRHTIHIHYEKAAEGSPWINLLWTRPGSQSAVIPASALFPPPPQVLGPAV